MRIAFVVNSLIYGGAETQLIALTRELASRGHAVMIYTLRDENPRAGELSGSGVKIVADRKRWKFDAGLVLRIRKAIVEFQADVVHGFLHDGNFNARLAAVGTGIPALNSERSSDYDVPLMHRLGLALTRRLAAGVVANSHAGGRFAQRLFRLPDSHVHVVWNGIATDGAQSLRAESAVDPATTFFGAEGLKVASLVGMMRPEKDHHLALRVAQALEQRDARWRVLLVGDALPQTRSYKASVLKLHQELNLGRLVTFAGLRVDVKQIVHRSNVLFSTSLQEGFPNVVLEAMSVGTPVVSTDYSDIRLILPSASQVVNTREPGDIADAIVRADTERAALVDRQRRWLQANATIATAASRLEAVYSRYIDERPYQASRRPPVVIGGTVQ